MYLTNVQYMREKCQRAIVACAAGLLLTAGAVNSVAEEHRVAPPRVELLNPEVDLGTQRRGDEAEAEFKLRNNGDQPLRILRVRPG